MAVLDPGPRPAPERPGSPPSRQVRVEVGEAFVAGEFRVVDAPGLAPGVTVIDFSGEQLGEETLVGELLFGGGGGVGDAWFADGGQAEAQDSVTASSAAGALTRQGNLPGRWCWWWSWVLRSMSFLISSGGSRRRSGLVRGGAPAMSGTGVVRSRRAPGDGALFGMTAGLNGDRIGVDDARPRKRPSCLLPRRRRSWCGAAAAPRPGPSSRARHRPRGRCPRTADEPGERPGRSRGHQRRRPRQSTGFTEQNLQIVVKDKVFAALVQRTVVDGDDLSGIGRSIVMAPIPTSSRRPA